MEFLCELYKAQVARGRYFVHELTSDVNSRMKCVTHARNENDSGGSVHVWIWRARICQSKCTDGHQRETGTHRHPHFFRDKE